MTQVRDPAGGLWTYTYSTNASKMLETVTSPGPHPDIRRYHYEDATVPTRLTGISIWQSSAAAFVRYSTYSYYSDGKVRESALAGGKERDLFVYGIDSTTVTDAKGLTTTYTTTTSVQEGTTKKVVGVSRASGVNCAAASAATTYDANGYIDFTLDWNGNKTDYSYSPAGVLNSITTGAGKPEALTRTFAWFDADLPSVTEYKDASGTSYASQTITYFTVGLAARRIATETWTDLTPAPNGGSLQVTYSYTFHPNNALATVTSMRQLPGGAN